MIPIAGQPIVTAARMRAAEKAVVASGTSVETLMARAGEGIAVTVRRLAAQAPVLVLCGPGNNGGDGYVAATRLRATGADVRVAALAEPRTDAARVARAAWDGPVASLAEAVPAPVLVDCLFGTGLTRGLADDAVATFHRLAEAARLVIAVDLPSGIATDTGALLSAVPAHHVTLALGAVKPAHLLQPAAARMGAVRLIDIGVPVMSEMHVLAPPPLRAPGPLDHKYSRGMVAVLAGAMPGAARLAATAAMRAGAGYAALFDAEGGPDAVVHRRLEPESLTDPRISAVLVGPGLGRDAAARARLDQALAAPHPAVIDGDALHLVSVKQLATRPHPVILTPHAGEFAALFGPGEGSKIDRARAAARLASAIVVFKGADTVIAAPDGRVAVAPDASAWLSTAGTGDVLAGAIAAMLASGLDPFAAAQAGVWLHGEAARRLGPAFIADDLANALTAARAGL